MDFDEEELEQLEDIRADWGYEGNGYCSDIAEEIVSALGGHQIQFCHQDSTCDEFQYDPSEYSRHVPIIEINTPYDGRWVYGEYLYHQCAVINGYVIDLFFNSTSCDIEDTIFDKDEYIALMQENNNQELKYFED